MCVVCMEKRKMNARQQEYEQRQKDMLSLAFRYLVNAPRLGDYDFAIPKESFLPEYRVIYHVSPYASDRYFNDFVVTEWFIQSEDRTSFKISKEKAVRDNIRYYYGLEFPEPKQA
jgi:hypothetical protein